MTTLSNAQSKRVVVKSMDSAAAVVGEVRQVCMQGCEAMNAVMPYLDWLALYRLFDVSMYLRLGVKRYVYLAGGNESVDRPTIYPFTLVQSHDARAGRVEVVNKRTIGSPQAFMALLARMCLPPALIISSLVIKLEGGVEKDLIEAEGYRGLYEGAALSAYISAVRHMPYSFALCIDTVLEGVARSEGGQVIEMLDTMLSTLPPLTNWTRSAAEVRFAWQDEIAPRSSAAGGHLDSTATKALRPVQRDAPDIVPILLGPTRSMHEEVRDPTDRGSAVIALGYYSYWCLRSGALGGAHHTPRASIGDGTRWIAPRSQLEVIQRETAAKVRSRDIVIQVELAMTRRVTLLANEMAASPVEAHPEMPPVMTPTSSMRLHLLLPGDRTRLMVKARKRGEWLLLRELMGEDITAETLLDSIRNSKVSYAFTSYGAMVWHRRAGEIVRNAARGAVHAAPSGESTSASAESLSFLKICRNAIPRHFVTDGANAMHYATLISLGHFIEDPIVKSLYMWVTLNHEMNHMGLRMLREESGACRVYGRASGYLNDAAIARFSSLLSIPPTDLLLVSAEERRRFGLDGLEGGCEYLLAILTDLVANADGDVVTRMRDYFGTLLVASMKRFVKGTRLPPRERLALRDCISMSGTEGLSEWIDLLV